MDSVFEGWQVALSTVRDFMREVKLPVQKTVEYLWPGQSVPFDIPSYKRGNVYKEPQNPMALERRLLSMQSAVAMIYVMLLRKQGRASNLPNLCCFLNRLFAVLGLHGLTFELDVAGIRRHVLVGSDGAVQQFSFWDAFFFEFHGPSRHWADMVKDDKRGYFPYSDATTHPLEHGRLRLVDVLVFASEQHVQSLFPCFKEVFDVIMKKLGQFMREIARDISTPWTSEVNARWCATQQASFAQQWILQRSVRDGKAHELIGR